MVQDNSNRANNKSTNAPTHRKTRKKPKKITESYLHNSGLYYLERYSSSVENFRSVMMRKIQRSCREHTDQKIGECQNQLNDLIEKFIRVGLLDDGTYTRSIINAKRRQGKSVRAIQTYLRSKGVSSDIIEQMLADYSDDHNKTAAEIEFESALIFARKKRLGPYRTSEDFDSQKELARLARAGYSYDTARRVLENDLSEDDLLSIGRL